MSLGKYLSSSTQHLPLFSLSLVTVVRIKKKKDPCSLQRDRSRPRGDWPCHYSTSGKGNSSQTGRGMSPTSKRKMFFVTWLISVLWCVKETVGGWIRREGAGVAEPSQRMRPWGTRGICFFSALCFRLTSLQLTSWGGNRKTSQVKILL